VTNYNPSPIVEIDGGLFYPDNTLTNIRISSGRRDVLEQPNASYANVELWTEADNPLDIELSDSLNIKLNNPTSGTTDLFTGTISDIDISLSGLGSVGSVARYRLTAVGSLALLNKRTVGATNFAKEFDGTRIYNILSEAFLTEWDDLDNLTTWADLPNTVTWASYDATAQALVDNLATDIDQPGQYELTGYSDGETNALQLAQLAAVSGRGVLYESGTGELNYDDYAARALRSPLILTDNDLLINGLSTNSQWGEIINDVTLTYKNNQTVNAQDSQSKILYGQLSGSKSTQLENKADAELQAQQYLETRAYPRIYPEQFTIPLHSPTISDATRAALLGVFTGLRVKTSDLPQVFGQTFDGFVEGYEWNLNVKQATLTLFVSAYSETYLSEIWLQVPQSTTWATYNGTTTWENA
jgi:hypothetical protein